jgi:hypothetical protein
LFAYRLAKDLGLKVEDVLDMTIVEFAGWAAFYKMEMDENKKEMQKIRSRR